MIAIDILAALPQVEAALSDPALDAGRRRIIATELLAVLPTGLSVQGAPQTFEYIRERIRHHRDRTDGAEPGNGADAENPAPRKTQKARGAAARA